MRPTAKTLILFTLLSCLTLSLAQNPLAPQPQNQPGNLDSFAGRFISQDGTIVLELQGTAGQYMGQLLADGSMLPFTAQGDLTGLTGTLSTPEADYVFTLQPSPLGVMLAIDGETIELQRQGGIPAPGMPPQPQPTPVPNPQPTPQAVPIPTPQAVPSSANPTPQPPQGPWQASYQLAVYSQEDPNQKQSGTLNIQVTPQPDGIYRVVSTLDGQPLVDMFVTAQGVDVSTGEEQYPLPWYMGQTSLYGIPAQTQVENGMIVFSVQSGSSYTQAIYDPSGVLVAYTGCENGRCTEMTFAR